MVNLNVDGAIRDEDNFAIGDDDDEEVEDRTEANSLSVSPPPYSESTPLSTLAEPPTPQRLDTNVNIAGGETNASLENRSQPETQEKSAGSDSSTYYIKSSDNLQGIALRFGLNVHFLVISLDNSLNFDFPQGRDLCRLNNLPPSTLTTTPHLLHTRPFLILPPSARTHVHSRLEVDQVHEARIAKERAEKRLQILTKEVDWRVAKAYVALADADSASSHLDLKNKEAAEVRRPRVESCEGGCSGTDLETNAVDRYLDDEEWERKTGRGVSVRHFPYASFSNKVGKDEESGQLNV